MSDIKPFQVVVVVVLHLLLYSGPAPPCLPPPATCPVLSRSPARSASQRSSHSRWTIADFIHTFYTFHTLSPVQFGTSQGDEVTVFDMDRFFIPTAGKVTAIVKTQIEKLKE